MATRTRTPKTTAEIKAALAAAKRKVATLEQRAYEGELTELIKAAHFVADYAAEKNHYPALAIRQYCLQSPKQLAPSAYKLCNQRPFQESQKALA